MLRVFYSYFYTIIDYHTTYKPEFPLNQIIDTIWVAKADSFDFSARHHAPLFTELIFNYGDQFRVEGENTDSFGASKSGHFIISGLKTTPFRTTLSGKHLNVGFLLKPHYYGILQRKLGSKEMFALSKVIFHELVEPGTPNFKKAEPALISFFVFADIDPDLEKFERQISPQFMRSGALRDFNHSITVTQKSFIEKFKKFYVITPSEFLRLKQVNYATMLIQRHPNAALTQIGFESGFYDQSHFIRVFKKHHGCTPKQFQNSRFGRG
ncbi:MAG: helix-turn-helix transcriptional regulator [Cytophagales bacterium]|nr:helix-turn-helix transcriptional regulator [Cytophagales bacterium]